VSTDAPRIVETTDVADEARPKWRRGRTLSDGSRIYWWKELVIVMALNLVYETVRNLSSAKPAKAYANAMRLIGWQRDLSIWHEHGIQQWALGFTPMIIAANYFYGSVYIIATVLGLVFLYRYHGDDYALWRNTLAIGTLLGLIGFATFPLMPPRLLDVMGDGHTYFGFVDTLIEYPTFWSFDSEAMKTISNQFAAMPSLHCAWAFWGLAVFYPRVRSWWAKSLAVLYPITTIYVVVITGNHYFLDALGGLFIMVLGYGGARAITRTGRGRPLAEQAQQAAVDAAARAGTTGDHSPIVENGTAGTTGPAGTTDAAPA
jgi:membrane-associated phospholipid phosphatase